MAVLVAYASKHGATREIAGRIAEQLQRYGKDAVACPVQDVTAIGEYEAVVLGSAVYYGAWLKDAATFVRTHTSELRMRPVWLFSSGPLGESKPANEQPPREIAEITDAIQPRDHHIFYGALDRAALSLPERIVVSAVHAPEGDYRDWSEVETWAEDIARALPSLKEKAVTR